MRGSIGRSMEPGTMPTTPTRQSRECKGLRLPLVVNGGPHPGRESGGIVSGNFPDSLITMCGGLATILRSESLAVRRQRRRRARSLGTQTKHPGVPAFLLNYRPTCGLHGYAATRYNVMPPLCGTPVQRYPDTRYKAIPPTRKNESLKRTAPHFFTSHRM